MPTERRVKVTLEAFVSPSEDTEKVMDALRNVLGGSPAQASEEGRMVRLVSEDAGALDLLRNQLRDRRIRGAARRVLMSGLEGDLASLMLNKQAAVVGVVALCSSPDQSPLGPIYAKLESEDISGVIDWLTAYESG
ncbi:MAG TPA: RNA-binding domain-containing protein [Nitrososphaerales archaeon]|nr:RNA-binding domain-containing protein [Nitrososphaerales archaeon]